jgi:hypothetical protein
MPPLFESPRVASAMMTSPSPQHQELLLHQSTEEAAICVERRIEDTNEE